MAAWSSGLIPLGTDLRSLVTKYQVILVGRFPGRGHVRVLGAVLGYLVVGQGEAVLERTGPAYIAQDDGHGGS